MKTIGITGGIGSGKTTVARLFENKGFLVYYADDRAKEVMNQDPELKAQLIALFGSEIFGEDGRLDRAKLAQIVFNDPGKLAKLNGVVHPAVARDFEQWVKKIPSDYHKKLIFKEAAILFEAGTSKASDAVLMVYAPKSIRLNRVMNRDQTDPQAVLSRMRNQWPDHKKCLLSDFVIFNDGLHQVEPQVDSAVKYFSERWK